MGTGTLAATLCASPFLCAWRGVSAHMRMHVRRRREGLLVPGRKRRPRGRPATIDAHAASATPAWAEAPSAKLTPEEKKQAVFKKRCRRDVKKVSAMSNHLITYTKCKKLYIKLAKRTLLSSKVAQCDDLAHRRVLGVLTANINRVAKYREKFGLAMLNNNSELTVLLI